MKCDMVRDGFFVTVSRQRIWEKELEIFSVFDSLCEVYDISYFAAFGTLLGAARHKGFIPWDDDISGLFSRNED